MKVVGISGLHRTIDFKRRMLPGLDEREYRVSQGFDAAAALVIDGRILAAAAEERFSGAKATERFPIKALQSVLSGGGSGNPTWMSWLTGSPTSRAWQIRRRSTTRNGSRRCI